MRRNRKIVRNVREQSNGERVERQVYRCVYKKDGSKNSYRYVKLCASVAVQRLKRKTEDVLSGCVRRYLARFSRNRGASRAGHIDRAECVHLMPKENRGRGWSRRSTPIVGCTLRQIKEDACVCVAEYLSLTTLRGLDDRKKQENTEGAREVQRENHR